MAIYSQPMVLSCEEMEMNLIYNLVKEQGRKESALHDPERLIGSEKGRDSATVA
jgi:hypothetical protein